MPTKEIIGGNKITERMLVPHLRRRGSGKSIFQFISGQEQELYGICGETIQQGKVVTLGTDKKIYIADALSNKPAFAFAKTAGNINEQIPLQVTGPLSVETIDDTNIGDYIYLRSNGNIGTVERFNAGDLIQIVGIKIDENQIEVFVLEPEKIE